MTNRVVVWNMMRRTCRPDRVIRACGKTSFGALSAANTITTARHLSSSSATTKKPVALFLNASRLDYDRQLGT